MTRPDDFKWWSLKRRLIGLDRTGNNTLEVEHATYAAWCDEHKACVRVWTRSDHTIAHITASMVTITYQFRSKLVHRRLNELLHGWGWAVAERNDTWSIVRRGDTRLGHPFPPDYTVALDHGGHIIYSRNNKTTTV